MDFELANALGRIVELKDRSTAAHTWRVTMYAQAVAESAHVPMPRLMNFMLGAVLHDLGKIDVPDRILAKPGRLDDDEFEIIKSHTTMGHERLRRLGVTEPMILDVVRSHHERIDGFDAMTSLRPYRDARGREAARRAIEDLEQHVGTWYEPEAVAVFRDLFERGRLDSTLEHLNDPDAHSTLTGPLSEHSIELARDALLRSNPPGIDHPEVDALLEQAVRSTDPDPARESSANGPS